MRADCTEISFDRDKKKMINSDCGIRIDSNQHFIEFNTGGSWEGEPGRIHQSSAPLHWEIWLAHHKFLRWQRGLGAGRLRYKSGNYKFSNLS